MLPQLLIIRHGQSDAQKTPDIREDTASHPIGLTELGKRQAAHLAHTLPPLLKQRNIRKLRFVVSPYARAQETFLPLCRALQRDAEFAVSARTDVGLRERHRGLFPADLPQPDDTASARRRNFEKVKHDRGNAQYVFIPTGGESPAQVIERGARVITDEAVRQVSDPADAVVFVCHDTLGRLLIQHLEGGPDMNKWEREDHLLNACPRVVENGIDKGYAFFLPPQELTTNLHAYRNAAAGR